MAATQASFTFFQGLFQYQYNFIQSKNNLPNASGEVKYLHHLLYADTISILEVENVRKQNKIIEEKS